jgi:hypothetical protein
MIFEFEGFGFKFGLYASAITQKEAGCSISELFKRMQSESDTTLALLHYFYGAAVSYNESKGIKDKLSLDSVGDLLEKIGLEKAMEVFNESLRLPKNSEAPKETGQI